MVCGKLEKKPQGDKGMVVRFLRVEDGGDTRKTILAAEQELWVSLSSSTGRAVAWPMADVPFVLYET